MSVDRRPTSACLFDNNGGNGLEITRSADAIVGSVTPVRIRNVVSTNNSGDGVLLTALGVPTVDRYLIEDSMFFNNDLSGAHFDVRADGRMDVDIDSSEFFENMLDGVQLTEVVNSSADARRVSGSWTRSLFLDNGRHGANIDASTGTVVIGHLVDPSLGNLFEGNLDDGISITGPGRIRIGNNVITDNGDNGADDAGIDINSRTFADITIASNAIVDNRGDGLELRNGGPFSVEVEVTDNLIDFNDGRVLMFSPVPTPRRSPPTSRSSSTTTRFPATCWRASISSSPRRRLRPRMSPPPSPSLPTEASTPHPGLRFDMDGNEIHRQRTGQRLLHHRSRRPGSAQPRARSVSPILADSPATVSETSSTRV